MRDDLGVFNPITMSCFDWMDMRRHRPEAWAAELEAVGAAGCFDGLRWFGSMYDVSWEDRFSDVRWPDYWQIAEACLVEPWERYQLRAQIVLGSEGMSAPDLSSDAEWEAYIDRWGALARAHPEKILFFQICNEGGAFERIRRLGQRLAGQCPVLVAPDTAGSQEASVALYGDAGFKIYSAERDRDTSGTGGTFEPYWDIYEWPIMTDGYAGQIPDLVWDIEPIGPYSSQYAIFEVDEIAFLHWLAFVLGAGGTTFHNGVGMRHGGAWDVPPVFDQGRAAGWGAYNTGQGIPIRYTDTPHWPAIVAALGAVREVLPPGIANWRRYNGHWDDNPICYEPYRNPDPAYPGGYDNGCFDDGTLFKAITATSGAGQIATSYLGLAHRLEGIYGRERMRLRELDPHNARNVLREFETDPERPFTIERPFGMFQGELF